MRFDVPAENMLKIQGNSFKLRILNSIGTPPLLKDNCSSVLDKCVLPVWKILLIPQLNVSVTSVIFLSKKGFRTLYLKAN